MKTHTKKQITVGVPDDVDYTVTRDGNLVVHSPGGPVGVEPVSGVHFSGSYREGRDAADLAPASFEWVGPGAAAIFASRADMQAAPGSQWTRPNYWSVPGRSMIDEMLAVICVPWGKQDREVFRPPAIGVSPTAVHMRSKPIFVDGLRLERLPKVKMLQFGPELNYYVNLFSDFCGDIYDGQHTDTRTPDNQHPGYGTYLASVVSQALLRLCSSAYSIEEKKQLAAPMVQWGLDLAGAFSDGRNNTMVGGGHMAGRKALVILAGFLLGEEPLTDPNKYLGKVFMEDCAFDEHGWMAGVAAREQAGPWAEKRTWSVSLRQNAMNYVDQVTGAQIGTALAMRLMGLTAQMGVHHYEWCRAWMEDMVLPGTNTPNPAHPVVAVYQHNAVASAFGADYAVGGGVGVCASAWKQTNGGR